MGTGCLELPSGFCCAAAALDTDSPVCFEPGRRGCARSAADPSPSSPAAASSAEPSAVSGRCDAPPAEIKTEIMQREKEKHRQRFIRSYSPD